MAFGFPNNSLLTYSTHVDPKRLGSFLHGLMVLESFGAGVVQPSKIEADGTLVYTFAEPTRLLRTPHFGMQPDVFNMAYLNNIVNNDPVYAKSESEEYRRIFLHNADDNYRYRATRFARRCTSDIELIDLLTEQDCFEQFIALRNNAGRARKVRQRMIDTAPGSLRESLRDAEATWSAFERAFILAKPPPAFKYTSRFLWGDGKYADVVPEVARQHILRLLTLRPHMDGFMVSNISTYQSQPTKFNQFENNITQEPLKNARNRPLDHAIELCEGLPVEQTLFRREREAFPKDLLPGSSFYKNNITSVSYIPGDVTFGLHLMVIRVPPRFPIYAIWSTHSSYECELVLPAGCRYLIEDVYRVPNDERTDFVYLAMRVRNRDEMLAVMRKAANPSIQERLQRIYDRADWDDPDFNRNSKFERLVAATFTKPLPPGVEVTTETYVDVMVVRVVSAPVVANPRFPRLSYPPLWDPARLERVGAEIEAYSGPLQAPEQIAAHNPRLKEIAPQSHADRVWLAIMAHLPPYLWACLQCLSRIKVSERVLELAQIGTVWARYGKLERSMGFSLTVEIFQPDLEDSMSVNDLLAVVSEYWSTAQATRTDTMRLMDYSRAKPDVRSRGELTWFFESQLNIPEPMPVKPAGALRFMTYNVQEWRHEAAYDVVRAANADVVLLQEARHTQDFIDAVAEPMGYKVGFCAAAYGFGNMVLSRLPLEGKAEALYLPADRERRCAVRFRVMLDDAAHWAWVVSVHLDVYDTTGRTRAEEARVLFDKWIKPALDNGETMLIAGDMNEVWIPEMSEVRQEDFIEAMTILHQAPPGTKALKTLRTGLQDVFEASGIPPPEYTVWNLTRVDHVFCSKDFSRGIVSARVVKTPGSDHLPVLVDWAPPATITKTKSKSVRNTKSVKPRKSANSKKSAKTRKPECNCPLPKGKGYVVYTDPDACYARGPLGGRQRCSKHGTWYYK